METVFNILIYLFFYFIFSFIMWGLSFIGNFRKKYGIKLYLKKKIKHNNPKEYIYRLLYDYEYEEYYIQQYKLEWREEPNIFTILIPYPILFMVFDYHKYDYKNICKSDEEDTVINRIDDLEEYWFLLVKDENIKNELENKKEERLTNKINSLNSEYNKYNENN